ncbi:hypothetical protein [Marinobacter sp.]|uniref:hypothetical protein n=1 Tax=Marinobacter sp. TaxID=50741 RepID=UPI003F97B15B
MVNAIVGIEIQVESLTRKVKASQNHPERNRAGVKAGLAAGTASEQAMSAFISWIAELTEGDLELGNRGAAVG